MLLRSLSSSAVVHVLEIYRSRSICDIVHLYQRFVICHCFIYINSPENDNDKFVQSAKMLIFDNFTLASDQYVTFVYM